MRSFTFTKNQIIEGELTSLRVFNDSDITPTYIDWLNNPQVVRYSNQRFYKHTKETCHQYLASFCCTSNYFFAIHEKLNKKVIGTLTIYQNVYHQVADIGIMIGDTKFWGRGMGLDAFSATVKFLDASGQIRKITAGTMAKNKAMLRIMELSGLELEAVRRDHELLDDEPVDVAYYARFCSI